jgi:hypothetical protein
MKVKEFDWIAASTLSAIITEQIPGFASPTWNGWQELNRAPHTFSTPIFHPPTA